METSNNMEIDKNMKGLKDMQIYINKKIETNNNMEKK